MAEPLGELIDALGVEHEPHEGELIESVLVVLKVITEDGRPVVRHSWSPGTEWPDRLSMLVAAALREQRDMADADD